MDILGELFACVMLWGIFIMAAKHSSEKDRARKAAKRRAIRRYIREDKKGYLAFCEKLDLEKENGRLKERERILEHRSNQRVIIHLIGGLK